VNALSQIVGALIEAWGEVKVQKARVVLSLVGVVAAVAAMTVVIALGDLILQSSRELAELYEGRSVTVRLAPEQSSANQGEPSNDGPTQETGTGEGAQASSTVERPDDKDPVSDAMVTLAARQLARQRVQGAGGQADERDQLLHALGPRGLIPDTVHAQRVSELVRDVHAGIQGGSGVLEDHGDDATDLPAGGGATLRDLLAIEEHLALRRHLQATHDVRGRGLATAGLADDAKR